MLIAAVLFSNISYAFEPIFDDSNQVDYSGMTSSGTGIVSSESSTPEVGNPNLTLTGKSFNLDINTKGRTLSGAAKYKLKSATDEAQTLPVQINTGLNIDNVLINGAEGKAVRGETEESSTANWSIELPAAAEYDVEISCSGRICNDNTILQRVTYGIADGFVWLPQLGVSPSLDINVADDSTFSGTLSLDKKLEPVFKRGKPVKGDTKNGKPNGHIREVPANKVQVYLPPAI